MPNVYDAMPQEKFIIKFGAMSIKYMIDVLEEILLTNINSAICKPNVTVIKSPYSKNYCITNADAFSNIVCIRTTVTFLNKLLFKKAYEQLVGNAIDRFVAWSKKKNTGTIITSFAIIHFLMLCYQWLESHTHTHNTNAINTFFMNNLIVWEDHIISYTVEKYSCLYDVCEELACSLDGNILSDAK